MRAVVKGKPYDRVVATKATAEKLAAQWQRLRADLADELEPQVTRLSPADLRAYESLHVLLGELGITPQAAGVFLARHYQPPARSVSWQKAHDELVSEKERKRVTKRQIEHLSQSLRRLCSHLGSDMSDDIPEISRADIEGLIQGCAKPSTANGYLSDVRTVCKWLVRQKYLAADPTDGVDKLAVDDDLPAVLQPAEAEAILRHLEANDPELVPYFALCLFSGIRSSIKDGEIRRLHDDLVAGEQVFLPGGIRVRPKVRSRPRIIPWEFTGPLREWLDAYLIPGSGVIVGTPSQMIKRVAAHRALFPGWSHNVLRHTAASALCHSGLADEAQYVRAMGNSFRTNHAHYQGLWSSSLTQSLWAILPIAHLKKT